MADGRLSSNLAFIENSRGGVPPSPAILSYHIAAVPARRQFVHGCFSSARTGSRTLLRIKKVPKNRAAAMSTMVGPAATELK